MAQKESFNHLRKIFYVFETMQMWPNYITQEYLINRITNVK